MGATGIIDETTRLHVATMTTMTSMRLSCAAHVVEVVNTPEDTRLNMEYAIIQIGRLKAKMAKTASGIKTMKTLKNAAFMTVKTSSRKICAVHAVEVGKILVFCMTIVLIRQME